MLYTVNSVSAAVLAKLAKSPRMGELELRFSRGWDESIDRRKGYFVRRWGRPDSWDDVILQGPHIHVANPAFKQPNETMKHNQEAARRLHPHHRLQARRRPRKVRRRLHPLGRRAGAGPLPAGVATDGSKHGGADTDPCCGSAGRSPCSPYLYCRKP